MGSDQGGALNGDVSGSDTVFGGNGENRRPVILVDVERGCNDCRGDIKLDVARVSLCQGGSTVV